MKTTLLHPLIKASLALLALTVVLSSCQSKVEIPETETATLLPVAKKIGDFKLTHGADEFNLDTIKDQWSLFFFGYTRCPDICPTALFMLAEMMREIERDPSSLKQIPQVIFVSVDPQQDKPKALQEFTAYYHASFKGVTGAQQEVDKLAGAMGAFYERAYHLNGRALLIEPDDEIPEGLENSYLINHSASIVLTNPKGEMHAVFSTPHVPEVMIRDLAAIQKAW